MRVKIELGQYWQCKFGGLIYHVTRFHANRAYAEIEDICGGSDRLIERYFVCIDSEGYTIDPLLIRDWKVVSSNGLKRKPKKVIPGIPLDPSLPLLEAGHLQDRARKKYRK